MPLCFYCNRTVEPNALFPRRFVGTWKLYTALVPSRKWIGPIGQIILLGILQFSLSLCVLISRDSWFLLIVFTIVYAAIAQKTIIVFAKKEC